MRGSRTWWKKFSSPRALLRAVVDDALCLADRALDGVGRHVSHVGADADIGLDRLAQPLGAFAFHQHREMVERSLRGKLEDVVRAETGLLEDQPGLSRSEEDTSVRQ